MKINLFQKLFALLCLLSVPCLSTGCGNSGGTPGDANDPAQTSDQEQMQDETGDVDNVATE